LFKTLKGKEVIVICGSSDECLLDIEVCGLSMGVNIKRNPIYTAQHCPIKINNHIWKDFDTYSTIDSITNDLSGIFKYIKINNNTLIASSIVDKLGRPLLE
jgi:hypothetical protein